MNDLQPPLPPVEVTPRDISGLRRGNTGIDYVHTFDSGRPGPHVMLNALTHGNELCGMTALCLLFDQGFQPHRGRLTLSFANVAAYEAFNAERPFDNRFVDRDFNRVWTGDVLDSDDSSVEVRRAREMRPAFETVDALLDLHSTSFAVPPMLCYQGLDKARALAGRLAGPVRHIVSPGGRHSGGLLIEYSHFGDPQSPSVALLVECGQHFAASSGDVAIAVVFDFLARFGLADEDSAAAHRQPVVTGPRQVYEISEVVVAQSDRFRFAGQFQGFEEFAAGELIALDGDAEVRAPYDRCTLIMPRRQPVKGGEAATLAQRL